MPFDNMTAQPITPSSGFESIPMTEPGRKFVRLAEMHAQQFAERSADHDRDGSFPFENFKDMQQSCFLAATVPEEYGGLGVRSLHDVMIGMSRLARGDGSTAIAANMHIAGASVAAQFMRRSLAEGDSLTAGLLAGLLRQVGSGEVVLCFPTTERGTDLMSPNTEATPVEGGYLVNGRKIFGTLAPAAHLFFPSVRVPREGGGYLTATVMVSRDTPGLRVEDNWDALGMRASGSNDITFTDCFVPAQFLFALRDNYAKVGQGFATFALTANLPLISAFLGIAERAREYAVRAADVQKGPSKKRMGDRIPIQQLIAEIEIDLSVCRAMIERTGRIADEFMSRYETGDPAAEESNALMKETQCMKYVVNRKAIEIVDRAMIVCGGAAYMSGHPLSRLYRDARAGPFMQPFAPYEALEYIGKVTLNMPPALDR